METVSQLVEQKEILDDTADRINDVRVDMNDRVGKVLSKCTDQPEALTIKEWVGIGGVHTQALRNRKRKVLLWSTSDQHNSP